MKLVLKFVVSTVLVLFMLREARYFFASDEERIEWCIEDMISGFNDARLGKASAGLHRTWNIPETNIGRPVLQDGLRSLFFTEKHPETRAFALEAQIPPESWESDVRKDSATVNFIIEFTRLGSEAPTAEWIVQTQNELINDADQGWCLTETRYESLSGSRLGRHR